MRTLLAALTSLALVLTVAAPALATGPEAQVLEPAGDAPSFPQGEKQRALKAAAQASLLSGEVAPRGDNKVVRVANGQYVELARVGEDPILTVLGEFGTQPGSHDHGTPDEPNVIAHGGTAGPLHNEIAEPDRTVDNSTIWAPDFSEAYYEELLFSEAAGVVSMRNFYIELSSGRYTLNGDVTPWVQVPYNAAAYGSNYCGGIICQDTWRFVNDSVDAFATSFADDAALNAYLAQFDVWDRYDIDGDGEFNEPDSYIDHFQSVHAGEGEETGGGPLGTDAIWSHRWFAYFSGNGPDGRGPRGAEQGGVRIGTSDYWIGDYTVEPENGGVGVFAHEYGHDLGLPDLYDTSGNTGGAENSTGFWTLMSSGSYGNSGRPADGIGTKPIHMGAWEKFQLGWLNYEVAVSGERSSHRIGPAAFNTKQAQGVFVVLPDRRVPLDLGPAYAGTKLYWSGQGNDLDSFMTKQVTLPAGAIALTAKVRYAIETDWDYAYVVVSTDGGTTWTNVDTNRSTDSSPNSQNFGNGITGTTAGAWVDLTADLSPFAGQTVRIGFRYWTDAAAVEAGFQIDDLLIPGQPLDGAEADAGWTFDGFKVTTGAEIQEFFNAYVLENRQYVGYDEGLRTGPYNFGFLDSALLQNFVEHFPYQDGLLISYWNQQYPDNNVGDHPGAGLVLPVDAHPRLVYRADGAPWRPRVQTYDSTFGLQRTDAITLHWNSAASSHGGLAAVPVFDDRLDWYVAAGEQPGANGWSGVDVPTTGTVVRIKSNSSTGFLQIEINE